jgi:GABA(A) receptor-associated protein
MNFKHKYTLRQRVDESNKVLLKYKDKVPIICEKDNRIQGFDIDKKKYLVPKNLPFGQFIKIIRQRLKLNEYTSLFLIINNEYIPSNTCDVGFIYNLYKDMDGYLYITYSLENTFGSIIQ